MFESYYPQNTIGDDGFLDSLEKKAENLNRSESFRGLETLILLDDIERFWENGTINEKQRDSESFRGLETLILLDDIERFRENGTINEKQRDSESFGQPKR